MACLLMQRLGILFTDASYAEVLDTSTSHVGLPCEGSYPLDCTKGQYRSCRSGVRIIKLKAPQCIALAPKELPNSAVLAASKANEERRNGQVRRHEAQRRDRPLACHDAESEAPVSPSGLQPAPLPGSCRPLRRDFCAGNDGANSHLPFPRR